MAKDQKDTWKQFWGEHKTYQVRTRTRWWFPTNPDGSIAGKVEEHEWVVKNFENYKLSCDNCCLIINFHEQYLKSKLGEKNEYSFQFRCHLCKWKWKFEYWID